MALGGDLVVAFERVPQRAFLGARDHLARADDLLAAVGRLLGRGALRSSVSGAQRAATIALAPDLPRKTTVHISRSDVWNSVSSLAFTGVSSPPLTFTLMPSVAISVTATVSLPPR